MKALMEKREALIAEMDALINMGETEVARHARFIGAFKPAGQAAYMRQ